MHSKGSDTYYIIEKDFRFILDGKLVFGNSGDTIIFPKGTPHRFVVGHKGGSTLVISHPKLDLF